jgi:hypothetical protein
MMAALVAKNVSTPQHGCNNRGGKLRTAHCDLVFQSAIQLIFFWVDAKHAFRRWNLAESNNLNWGRRDSIMWTRWMCVAAICLGLAPQAEAAEHSGLVHRASCTVVRFYVAKFSAFAAETWARNHGATEAEIEAARHCLKEAPAQTAQAGQ